MQEIHRFEDIDEKIETFLRGKMSPAEAAEFKCELQADKELLARAKTAAILIKSMKVASANRDKRVVDEIKGVKPFAITSRTISFYSKIAAVAACFCLIFSITADFQVRKSNTIDLALSYSSQIESFSTGITRGDEDSDVAKNISDIVQLSNLDERISKLKSMYEKASSEEFNELTPYHADLGLYLAITYLNNNDRKEAKVLLEQLLVQYPDNELFKTMLNEVNEIKGLFY